jgi:5-methyltetrahydrofolate--homocysteine methyltransferase
LTWYSPLILFYGLDKQRESYFSVKLGRKELFVLIIGENFNTSRKSFAPLVEKKDINAIHENAKKQQEAGADFIDVNCGTYVDKEVELLPWLVDTVQEAVDLPVSVDTPNPEAAAAALARCKKQPFLNSISGESKRFGSYLDLVKQYKTKVITMVMDDKGMPTGIDDRMANASKLVEDMTGAGVPIEDIYLDPLVFPVATDGKNAQVCIKSVKQFHERFKGIHTVCGLSNISHGLPARKIINRAFLVMLIAAGIDAVIINPLDKNMMALLKAALALSGQDEFCMAYINAHREGKLDL